MKFHDYVPRIKAYLQEHKQTIKKASIAVGGVALVVLFVALYMYNIQSKRPDIVYRPLLACELFTEQEAKELLGEKVINQNKDGDKTTVEGNRATSNCSYTDSSLNNMAVAAVAVRSGINDEGVRENKADFAAQKRANTTQPVQDVGDEAFFIPANGQLNILYDKSWILITYGKGDQPSAYTLEDALKVAEKVVKGQKS